MQNLRVSANGCFLIAFVFLMPALNGDAQESTKRSDPGDQNLIFETERSCKANKGNLRAEDLTVLGFRVGVSTIGDVQKRFPDTSPVKLTKEEEAEEGVCVKNEHGEAAVFATSVMGAPAGTLTAIYLAPAWLIEGPHLQCHSAKLPSAAFSSRSGIRVGTTSVQLSNIVRARVPAHGPFCVAYDIPSSQGVLNLDSEKLQGFTDSTGVEGAMEKGGLEWVGLWGITSD